jgi:hypothetical protein
VIDASKPVRFRMPDMRIVRKVGVTSNGDLLVEVENEIMRFRTDNGRERGRESDTMRPILVNEVVTSSGFYPLRTHGGGGAEPYGRGMSSLSGVWDDYGTAKFALELVCEDGKPKEAKIHVRS